MIKLLKHYGMLLITLLMFSLDGLCLLMKRRQEEGSRKKVLIVRLDRIGDCILWLDSVKRIRDLFPQDDYQITLLGNREWIPLVSHLPYFSDVWALDTGKFFRNIFYRFTTLRKIRRSGFHFIIQPVFSRDFLMGEAIIRVSGADERIAPQGDCSNMRPWQKAISDRWYTRLIPSAKRQQMELIRNAEFMRGLGLTEFRAGLPELAVTNRLPAGLNCKDYYVIVPGGSEKRKHWPVSNFMELSKRIYMRTGWTGIVCGTEEENELGRYLEQNREIPIRNWAGRTSLNELTEIIAAAHILIGNETGTAHIATAVSTPSVCILGGGALGRFMPYQIERETIRPLPEVVFCRMDCFNCNWLCDHEETLKDTLQCIKKITVDMAWKAVEKII